MKMPIFLQNNRLAKIKFLLIFKSLLITIYSLSYRLMRKSQVYSFSNQRQWENSISLQKKLLQVWQETKVDEYYQKVILAYFDNLSNQQTKWAISKQISDTHQRASLYFKLTHRCNLRSQSLIELKKLILSSGQINKNDNLLMSKICHEMKELRKNNLMIAQIIIQMSNQYISSEDQMPLQFKTILIDLDKDNNFIKYSWLNQYVIFQYGFDPFFTHHYDMKSKQSPQRPSQMIDKLFTLSISQYCRLFKVKNIIGEILGSRRYNFNQALRNTKILNPISTRPNHTATSLNSKNLIPSLQKFNNLKKAHQSLKSSKMQQSLERQYFSPQKLEKINNRREYENRYKYSLKDTIEIDRIPVALTKQRMQDIQSQSQQKQQQQHDQFNLSRYRFKNYANPHQQRYKTLPRDVNDFQQESSIKKSLPIKFKPLQKKNVKYNNGQFQYANQSLGLQRKKSQLNPHRQQQKINNISGDKKPVKRQQANADQLTNKITSERKEIKIKGLKFTEAQLLKYLSKYKFQKQFNRDFLQDQKWLQSLVKCQGYISQLYINNQPYVIAISMLLPDGNYLIKLWAPSTQCNQQNSIFLFKKYIEYIQKYTSVREIYYNGVETEEINVCKFTKNKEKNYSRKRMTPIIKKQQQYQSYLFLNCSHIYIAQRKQVNIFSSNEIQPFSNEKSFVTPSIANIDRTTLNKDILDKVKIDQNISDINSLNSLLKQQEMDTYEQSSSFQTKNIAVLRINFATNFLLPFLVGDGCLHFYGQQLYQSHKQLICVIKCYKDNSRMLFGKGFSNIKQFIAKLKSKSKGRFQWNVKMFYKQLYGKIYQQGVKDGCYGNVQISLFWQDQLQGRLKHNFTNFEYFGPEPFFVGIEIQQQLIYCFQVTDEDILF